MLTLCVATEQAEHVDPLVEDIPTTYGYFEGQQYDHELHTFKSCSALIESG